MTVGLYVVAVYFVEQEKAPFPFLICWQTGGSAGLWSTKGLKLSGPWWGGLPCTGA